MTTLRQFLPAAIAASVLACALAETVQAAGLVMPAKRRTAILEEVQALTDMENLALQKELSSLEYPFALEKPVEEKPVVVTPEGETVVEVVKPVITYTDKEVLDAFSASFNPVGMMARNDTNYLIVDVGGTKRPVEENTLIRFNFNDKAYNIRIGEVTDDDYLLSLGDTTLVRKLNESYDDETIKRFAPNAQKLLPNSNKEEPK